VNNFTNYSKQNTDIEYDFNYKSRLKFREQTKDMEDKADQLATFGGKRFLGLNKNGNEVWVSYNINRADLSIDIKTTHDLDSIVEYAPKRVTVGANQDAPGDLMTARQTDTGAVTKNTINYLSKLIHMVEGNVGKVDGKCSTQLFMYVSNLIYEGEWEPTSSTNKVRWQDILKSWEFPSGRYFTVYG